MTYVDSQSTLWSHGWTRLRLSLRSPGGVRRKEGSEHQHFFVWVCQIFFSTWNLKWWSGYSPSQVENEINFFLTFHYIYIYKKRDRFCVPWKTIFFCLPWNAIFGRRRQFLPWKAFYKSHQWRKTRVVIFNRKVRRGIWFLRKLWGLIQIDGRESCMNSAIVLQIRTHNVLIHLAWLGPQIFRG